MTIFLECNQLEDAHDILAYDEIFEPGSQFARTLPSAIVDPIIAIWRGTHLTKPTKDSSLGSVDGDASVERVVRSVKNAFTRKSEQSLLGRCSPCLDYGWHLTEHTIYCVR